MKNKLKKRNQTKFDYTMKKLGIVSFVLSLIAFAVIIPLSNHLKEENVAINQNIELLARQEKSVKQYSEYKYFSK